MASDVAVSNVQFDRPVPYEQLPELMSQVHLCLGISEAVRKHSAGCHKVLFGLAMERPVPTWDTPANKEIVTHGENIWLCPMGDALALADSISKLKQRPDLRAKIAQRGHELFLKDFARGDEARSSFVVQESVRRRAVTFGIAH